MKTNLNNFWQTCSWRNLQQKLYGAKSYLLSVATFISRRDSTFFQYNNGTLNIEIQKTFVVAIGP